MWLYANYSILLSEYQTFGFFLSFLLCAVSAEKKKKKVGGKGLDTSNQHGSSLALTISWVEERDQSERKRRETHRHHLGPDLEPSPMELKVGFMA